MIVFLDPAAADLMMEHNVIFSENDDVWIVINFQVKLLAMLAILCSSGSLGRNNSCCPHIIRSSKQNIPRKSFPNSYGLP